MGWRRSVAFGSVPGRTTPTDIAEAAERAGGAENCEAFVGASLHTLSLTQGIFDLHAQFPSKLLSTPSASLATSAITTAPGLLSP